MQVLTLRAKTSHAQDILERHGYTWNVAQHFFSFSLMRFVYMLHSQQTQHTIFVRKHDPLYDIIASEHTN